MNYAGKFDAAISLDGQGSYLSGHGHIDSFTAKAHGHVPDGAIVVPDPNLIFNGEFKRAGLDLVLSHEGHEFVVHDYFRGDKRTAIASPDGAHLTGDIVNALTGYVQVAQAASGVAAAQIIGHVTKLSGSATAVRNGVSVILNNGDNVEKGDVVSTGGDSTLGITFIDGTVFGLSSNARMVLNEMVYDPNGSNNSSLLSLVAGTITFVAGETAKHGDMKIDTPVATMGIRGTAVLSQIHFVVPTGGGDPQPEASFQVLVEPNGTTGSYILFDKVTLLPIATVNQAGQVIQISGGNVSISNALMSPDVQKLITDVFTLKFTDNNSNTKLTSNFTDSITQTSQDLVFKSGAGPVVIATFVNLNTQGSEGPGNSTQSATRIPGQPLVQSLDSSGNVKTVFALTERADTTGDTADSDTISGRITFVDQNLGDRPTVSINLADAPNYVYKTAGQQDVTGSLTALQKQDILATQIHIDVVADGGNTNNGSAVWTYTIPDHAFDFLAAGETLTLTYMVRIDTNFQVSPESKFIPITITITGTNDKPTVATAGGAVIEKVGTGNTALDTITGAVTFADVDLTDRPVVSAALSSTQPFKYLDAHGHDISASLTPQQLAAITAVEVPLNVVQGAENSNNGSATWTYSVPDHLFDFLADGETLVLNYVIQVDDGHGGVVSTPITVSINGADVSVEGTNDVPTIVVTSTTPTGAVKEDAAASLLAGGTISFNDPDLTDTHTASFALKSTTSSAHLPGFGDGTSQIGTFALTPVSESPGVSTRGSVDWSFTLDDSDPVLQSLAEGQTITQVYTVTVDDHHGGTVTQDVTVVITGTNDAPTITSNAAAAAGAVTEDAATPTLSTSGTLVIQDLDLIDTHSAAAVFKSSASSAHLPGFSDGTSLGTFTIDPSVTEFDTDTDNGAKLGWHFSLDNGNAVLQSLAQGQSITEVYTITFTDNHNATVTQDVTVTIDGANDAPTITSNAMAAAGVVTEDTSATLSIDGTLAIQDLDLIDTHTASSIFKSSTSSAHLPEFNDGTALGTFTIDPAVMELNTDTDNGATLGWHFSLDNGNAVLQSLAQGQSITEIYTVTFTDHHGGQVSQDVTVTINGANDAPTVTSDAAAAMGGVVEDAATPRLSTGGTLAIQDLDLTDTHTATAVFESSSVSSALSGFDSNSHIGAFKLDPPITESSSDTDNGATLGWHFSLNDNDPVLQSLAEGQTITQVYTVTFADNHNATVTQDVTVTIAGTNDAPTLSGVNAGTLADSAATDTFSDLAGQLAGTDTDDGETATLVYSVDGADSHGTVAGHYGSLTVNSNGTYDYAPAPTAINALPEGSYHDTFTIRTTDVHGAAGMATFTVDVTGANDAPTLSNLDIGTLTDTAAADSFSNLTGKLAGNDVDIGEKATLIYAVLDTYQHAMTTVGGHYGSLTVNSDGSYSYVPNATAINALPEGAYSDIFTVQTTDVHGAIGKATLTVDVTGANDAPVFNLDHMSVRQDDDEQVIVHGLTVTDLDAAQNERFTLAATTEAFGSNVSPSSRSGSLANVNASLNTVTYNEGSAEPSTDKITLTVTDGHGSSDTIHLIFSLPENANDHVSATGTTGKDVFIGTGYHDQFVFAANSNHDTILNFTTLQDHIDLSAVVTTSNLSNWMAQHVAASSADTLITLDAADTILLKGVNVSSLHASDFIVHA